jgi:hypothetical protein
MPGREAGPGGQHMAGNMGRRTPDERRKDYPHHQRGRSFSGHIRHPLDIAEILVQVVVIVMRIVDNYGVSIINVPEIISIVLDRIDRAVARVRPKKTVFIVPFSNTPNDSNFMWYQCTIGEAPAMQLSGRFHITNLSEKSLVIVDTSLKWRRAHSAFAVTPDKNNIHGQNPVAPGRKTYLSCDFTLVPSVRKPGQPLKARVVFVDNYGKKHKTKPVVFYSR